MNNHNGLRQTRYRIQEQHFPHQQSGLKQSIISAIAFVAVCVLVASCQNDPLTPLSDAPDISFRNDVAPIIISNCTQSGCHGNNGGAFRLTSYEDIIGKVSPGTPHSSKLYKVITANAIGQMPPSSSDHLSDIQIKTIYVWIAQGANNN